jgi:DNA-binding XRE family transcriptional regulator
MNIMQIKEHVNNHRIADYDEVLDARFGKAGTPEREAFRREAYAFYTGQILLEARKEAKVTQLELARRINATKSYISRIENGDIEPGTGTFYRIINALGLRVEVVKPVC